MEATGSGKGTKETRMFKYFIFAIMIFLSTFTGCGGDDGGGGNGNNKSGTPKPIRKVGVGSFWQVSAGFYHTCALASGGGGVKCWGSGTYAQLGNGSNNSLDLPGDPVQDSNGDPITGIVQISAGGIHSCALTNVGGVLCWGYGSYGRLGNNANTNSNHAVEVVDGEDRSAPLRGIVAISAGGDHSCALTEQGKVLCWGSGFSGKLGDGGGSEKSYPVTVVESEDSTEPLVGIVQISAKEYHTCALKSIGEVVCWGFGAEGRLGNGNTTDKNHPVTVIASEGSSNPLNDIVQISTGGGHTCALTSMGEVKCWGKGDFGELGNGSTDEKRAPVDVVISSSDTDPLSDIVQLGLGQNHTCALTSKGEVKCWGLGAEGQVGDDKKIDSFYPVTVVAKSGDPFALSDIVQVSGSRNHSCSLTSDGEVLCWGKGDNGRLGNNATDNQSAPVNVVADASDTPFRVGLWRREYACFSDGTCKFNPDSLLRPVLTGAREGASATPAVKVLGVEAGESVALHLDANCSGESIGTGTVATGETDVTITTSTLTAKENRIYAKAGSICSASGADYTLTGGTDRIAGDGEEISIDRTPTLTVNLLSNGDKVSIHKSADCSDTVLASGTATGASLDVTLSDLGNIGSHTLYLKQGDVCHPRGLGYKLANYVGEPSRVVGGEDFTCAVTNAGGVKCWGEGGSGRLGNNATADTDAPDDVDIDGSDTLLSGIIQVSAGGSLACALTSGGNVKCWGNGSGGRLGNDCGSSCYSQNLPVDVVSADGSSLNLSDIVQVSMGATHTCALTTGGNVKCWGLNASGQSGDNTTTNRDAPIDVVTSNTNTDPLSGIIQISAGGDRTCALTTGGSVKCWGDGNYGRLGNDCLPSCTDKSYPVDVVASDGNSSPLSGIVQISAGNNHTCALTSGGNVKCWGYGVNGEMGNGANDNKDAPVDVTISGSTALTGIISIASGGAHSCALKSGGGVVCWGYGANGQLGNNATGNQTHPVDVLTSALNNPALASIAQIRLGTYHSCAVTDAGVVSCWGKGGVGQLGNDCSNSSCADSSLPVDVLDEDGGSGVLNIGTKNRYACGDVRCAFIDN